MSLELAEVSDDKDFDTLIPLLWLSYSMPTRLSFLPLLFAAEADSGPALEEAIQTSKHALLRLHRAEPSSHWLKVTDMATGTIIAGGKWHVHESDPYTEAANRPFAVTSWPEGDRRDYATMCIGQVIRPRFRRYRKPHLQLQICFTHPEYRRHGAGRMIMQWGIDKADELGLETFIEATEMGLQLYKSFGFVTVSKDEVDTTVESPSTEWKDMQLRFPPIPWYCMWRPVEGKYIEHVTHLPW